MATDQLDPQELAKNIGSRARDAGGQILNTVSSLLGKDSEKQFIEITIMIMIALVVVIFVFWAYSLTGLQTADCNRLDEIYKSNQGSASTQSIATLNEYTIGSKSSNRYTPTNYMYDPSGGNARIFSYYVKTAYNCCSPGNFSNSFVSLCALKHAIALGARCLDFEIYSLDLEPVISTSTQSTDLQSSLYIKETFNSLKLADALYYIKYFALESSNEGAANYHDPLFLHFRIMTAQPETIKAIAKLLVDILGDHLLGSNYGQNSIGFSNNLYRQPILDFCGKCIIMVYSNTTNSHVITLPENNLFSLINIQLSSDTSSYQTYKYSQIKSMSDDQIEELTYKNKRGMSIVLPDNNNSTDNFDPRICFKAGCQFIAMNFQTFDSGLQTYFSIFDEVGFSYRLKPFQLRYTPVHYLIDYPAIQHSVGCATTTTHGGASVTL